MIHYLQEPGIDIAKVKYLAVNSVGVLIAFQDLNASDTYYFEID